MNRNLKDLKISGFQLFPGNHSNKNQFDRRIFLKYGKHFVGGVLLVFYAENLPSYLRSNILVIHAFTKNRLEAYFRNGISREPQNSKNMIQEDVKNILGLHLPTDPRWADLAAKSLQDILTDHAYCEQKAATSCISLIQRYSDREKLIEELSPIVTEEWGHFRLVLAELQKRNLKLGKQRKDEYVNELMKFEIKGGSEEDRFLDRLLIFALIEARSCERFKRLSEGLDDEYLRNFYKRFMESEAGHYVLFIGLAETYIDKQKVRQRWREWLEYEAEVMNQIRIRGDRIH
jgi:tRNA 2-(methylsulfanyl)-N6-isopentenyladenosine37 hydroxylase